MSKYANIIASATATNTSQMSPIKGREKEMVVNSAGGYTFKLDMWGYLDRFLILGSDTPSYYAGKKELTVKAAGNVVECIKADGIRAVNRIVEISNDGRAPKNDPAIFALALAAVNGNKETVQHAYANLAKVARTGTMLFQFVSAINGMGKWNAAAKRGIAAWYTGRQEDKLAVQLLKYQSRDGWAHRDVLRLAHVKPLTEVQSNLFRYAVKGSEGIVEGAPVPQVLVDFEHLKRSGADAKTAIKLINSNKDLTWEMIPTELQRNVDVWEALLPNMGMTALIRKLGQLTNVGLMQSSDAKKMVLSKLTDAEAIKRGRVHPITILSAYNQYRKGAGDKGSLIWRPEQKILDALDDAFYDAFNYVESTGQNYLLGVDCSGSMFGAQVSGAPNLTAAEVAGVMALAVAKREPNYWIGGFNHRMGELKITPHMRLQEALRIIQAFNWGSTDCALPMFHAIDNRMENVDKFVVITDNETYAGRRGHPSEALRQYREKYSKNSKLIVCGTSVTNFTIADPKDPGMLDIVGFDSSAPQLIQTF